MLSIHFKRIHEYHFFWFFDLINCVSQEQKLDLIKMQVTNWALWGSHKLALILNQSNHRISIGLIIFKFLYQFRISIQFWTYNNVFSSQNGVSMTLAPVFNQEMKLYTVNFIVIYFEKTVKTRLKNPFKRLKLY